MKILIIHSSALGDFITFLPFLKLLKYNYRSANITLITKKRYFPLLNSIVVNLEDVENFNFYKLFNENFIYDNLKSFFKKFDFIISFFGVEDNFFRLNLKQINKNTFFIFPHNKFKNLHQSLYLIENFPFEKIKFFYPDIKIGNKESKYILIHPGSGSLKKNVNIKFFIELSKKIEKELMLSVKWIGGEAELHLREYINIEIVNSIEELLKLIEKARFYIGNDSGVSHLVAATGKLCFTFFGPTSPYIWAPIGEKSIIFYKNLECSPCFPDCCEKKSCLEFDVDECQEKIIKFLT